MQMYTWLEFKLSELDGSQYGKVVACAKSPNQARAILRIEIMDCMERSCQILPEDHKFDDAYDKETNQARRKNLSLHIDEALSEEPTIRTHLILHG